MLFLHTAQNLYLTEMAENMELYPCALKSMSISLNAFLLNRMNAPIAKLQINKIYKPEI